MATGYEVQMYGDIKEAARALKGIDASLSSIAKSLETLAKCVEWEIDYEDGEMNERRHTFRTVVT